MLPTRPKARLATAWMLVACALACNGGSSGNRGKAGPAGVTPTDTELTLAEVAPAVVVSIESLKGNSGANFAPSDRIRVRFRLDKADGSPWNPDEMSVAQALVSGPSFRYQRVIPVQDDLAERAIRNKDGSFTYVFPKMPGTYTAPFNDSDAFGVEQGERTGQALESGTYTVGLFFAWDYTVDGRSYRQAGEATRDFLVGASPGPLQPRQVTAVTNCDQCHVQLQAHGGTYRGLVGCLLCHTAGAEDLNDPAIEGGTPGVAIDSRVLFHRLHQGRHLPSVLGLGLLPDGNVDYEATPKPFKTVGAGGVVRDRSDAGSPVFPNRSIPLPPKNFFGSLPSDAQAREFGKITGLATCSVCHGDPDGDGPAVAPADGGDIVALQSRLACGACHDDVDFGRDYVGPHGLMPPQGDETQCRVCHDDRFTRTTAVVEAHLHPLADPDFNEGVEINVLSVDEAGLHDGDGTLDPLEKISVTFTLSRGDGSPQPVSELEALHVVFAGPTSNANLLLSDVVPPDQLALAEAAAGGGALTLVLSQRRRMEFVGRSSAAPGELFPTALSPILETASTAVRVRVRVGIGVASGSLAVTSRPGQTHLDLVDASGFGRDDDIVLADGLAGQEEYLRVRFVEGNRLWFASPGFLPEPLYSAGPAFAHPAGTNVQVVLLDEKAQGLDYAVERSPGAVRELLEFGAGNAVLVDYTTDYVLPELYPPPFHDAPELGEREGEWAGLDLVDGTYRLGLWAYRKKLYALFPEVANYRITSEAAGQDVLVGGADRLESYALISSAQNCNSCHQDLSFHEGRARGFDACILCHGNAGSEDLPRAVAADAPATPGVGVDFRFLLHRVHRGVSLDDPGFEVVTAGVDAYPGNFDTRAFGNVSFPAQPGATKNCETCHGPSNPAWQMPVDRTHPDGQLTPTAVWARACIGCHDDEAADNHMQANTAPGGGESCAICHAPGEFQAVEAVHRPR